MQQYNKTQKVISFLLIFSIFFSFTFNVSFFGFFGTIFAQDNKNYNLVSLIVQEEIYDDIKNSIKTYAENIGKTIPNTKTIIIPTPKDTHPYNIASLNEKLYFEWYDWLMSLKWNSNLIWTIFIWDLALPVVENNWNFEKTVFPYVDFIDKVYIYDNNIKKYKLNTSSINTPKAEIWHSFISPNTWNEKEDVKQINDFFEKTNDFYSWKANFKTSFWITNWNQNENLDKKYEPYVFYYDQIRESKAVKYVDYKAYKSYLENIEDISYNRFSVELAKALQEKYSSAQSSFIWDTSSLFGEASNSIMNNILWPTTYNIPDIQTRHIIQKTTKKFLEIFNASLLGNFRKDVHNAWRYNDSWDKVWVDIIPYLLTVVDTLSYNILKNVSNDLEKNIDNLVKKGLSRDIAIIDNFVLWNSTYTNFLYGMQVRDISNASSCSIYRWSTYNWWNLVEANRSFNVNNTSQDASLCNLWQTTWYWWGNSIMNLNISKINQWQMWKLNFSSTTWAIVPLYDILWSLKSTNASKNPNPKDCFQNNLLLTTQYSQDEFWWIRLSYQVPINWASPVWWNCGTTNQSFPYSYDFDYTYKNFPTLPTESCEDWYLNLNWITLKTYSNTDCESTFINNWDWTQTTTTQTPSSKIYNFKKISSYITHKSPTADELSKQIKYMISPNLPIDKDRYIDFIAADNTYAKINYPYLYRITLNPNEEFSLENAKKSLKKYLDEKSLEINQIISSKNPSKLSWTDKTIYNLLKTWPYPEANIDLYKYLENKPDKEVEILWDKKTISYIDSLIFSIYWNNLNSVSAKYKFIFENYLSDQFGWNNFNFYLPKNKKQYEIAYLWAPWDAKNMYIKLNPEEKWENPYNDIISKNLDLNNYLLNIWSNSWKNNWNFKCAPPEWVPIWQWIPAVMCRLKDMLPPTISISDGNCWMSLISTDDENYFDSYDGNKNWIIDFLENEIKNWKLYLKSDATKYYYNKTWLLKAQILNSSWSVISFDNISKINFELLKVVVPKDEKQTFNEVNSKIIYDKTSSNTSLKDEKALEEAKKYVSFKDISAQVSSGQVQYNFVTKSNEANLVFKATLNLKDSKWNIIISKDDIINIQVRWELFYASTYKIQKDEDEIDLNPWYNSVIASNSKNIYLIEEEKFNWLKTNLNSLNALSNSKDKLFISLANVDKNNNYLDIKYPLVIKITDLLWKNILEPFSVKNLNSPISLWNISKAWVYNIEIKDKTWYVIKKEIEVMPDIWVKIVPNLSTNLMEKNWVITTNVFSIYDQFENPTIWTNYEVDVSISGNSLTFEDNSKSQKYQVFDWYKPFRLKSTSNIWVSNIKFSLKLGEKKIDEKVLSLDVVEKINFDLVWLPENIKVWNNLYDYKLEVKKENENTSFNSRAYLISNHIYIVPEKEYFDLKNNVWTWSFFTTLKAWEKIKLEFKIEWVKNSVYKEIDILPDLPIKINLSLSKSKIEASSSASSIVYAELKDRYDNVVWNDNSTNLNIEVLDKYKHIIKPTQSSKTVKKWKTNFMLTWTEIPGTAYFKISSNPNLSQNKIEIWQWDKKITIIWVWENAAKIESFYFWNKEKITEKKYNSIYTTLLWSNYWDITVKDNLANSIIFNKNNRSLAVTSLLNDLTYNQEILNIHPNWNVELNLSSYDISQDISSFFDIINGNLELSFFNNTFSNIVWKIYYNIDKSNLEIKNCSSFDISSCYSKNKNSLILKSQNSNYLVENISWDLVLKDRNNNILFTISSNGNISKDVWINFEIAKNQTSGWVFNLKIWNQIVWIFAINLINSQVLVYRDVWVFENIKNAKNSQVSVYIESRDYFYKEKYLWASTKDQKWITISYINPFESNSKKLSSFASRFTNSYEDFYKTPSLWWERENKILLSFAAGKSVWEATKDFMSFSLINIWDPVAKLKQIPKKLPNTEKTRKYDSTIWHLISKDDDNLSYNVFDYNNDWNLDVVILKRDWHIKLLEWTSVFWDFINRENIAFLSDLKTNNTIETWDFNWDKYDDIILLNKDRKPILLSNQNKKFERITLDLKLDWIISQIIAYDMDLDWKTDLVTLDDSWEINIFYGTSKIWVFEKKIIDSWFWIKLSEEIRNDLWALYFDWLYQLPNDKTKNYIKSSEELAKQVKNNLEVLNKTTNKSDEFNEWIIDNLIFTKINYLPVDKKINIFEIPSIMTPEMQTWIKTQNESVKSIIWTTTWKTSTWNIDYISDGIQWVEDGIQKTNEEISKFMENNADNLKITNSQLSSQETTFIRSEYSENVWLKVEKTFKDINSWFLKSGDIVKLNLKLTNITNSKINNIAYAMQIPKNFVVSTNPEYFLKIWNNQISSENIIINDSLNNEFSFLINSYKNWNWVSYFSLNPGESLEFSLNLITTPFKYGYIKAWFFDNQTNHSDIIYKDKNENCWEKVILYKSINTRNYQKDAKNYTCENKLPDNIAKNTIDKDKNWVPDYIDELIDGKNEDAQKNYSDSSLSDLAKDSDNDWIPDREDTSTNFHDDDDFMNSLQDIDVNVDEILAWIDTILAWLSCWFGWWWCISAPINRAPLAPGQDLSIFWLPAWDGLNIWEWLPIFSAINWMKVWKVCAPMPWPPGKNLPWCFWSWAWGRLGTLSPTNFIRIFITPTLTWAMWIAVCFWAPPILAWQTNPKTFHPFIPWWNCIVAAMPVFWCKNDGSDGEIYNMWEWNVINWNCTSQEKTPSIYLWEIAKDYINYKKTWNKNQKLKTDLKDIFSTVWKWTKPKWEIPNEPLLTMWNGSSSDINVDVDFWALKWWNFEDVLKINMKRISPFPDFIMEWVTRQIEEIANKLTDFPTLYIILPDFSWVYDSSWGWFMDKLKNSYDAWEQKSKQKQDKIQSQIDNLENSAKNIDCEKDQIWCLTNSLERNKLSLQKNISSNTTAGWIKSAYEFMSNLPIINIETQKVNFNIPWPGDKKTIDKAILDFEATKKQREEEFERAKQEWNIDNYNCVWTPDSIECKNIVDIRNLISSIDKNIAILQSYSKIPEDIYKMVKIKDIRIEQILCNLETISKITGWRIWDNGKRFKAWVQLYVLIKAILKSWQLLVDVFIDYDTACHECKNERYDLLYFAWKLVSMVMPKIPIIQFPKWPDIYLDLHNIRASINILLPEFEFNLKPILLPTLPRLYLPNSPSVNLSLPSLPLLPTFELPTLPELPSFPSINLPDLPPPPKLPKLLSSIEVFLNILKIITKIMCLLKSSPFVPEWRAWDQIAFITERSWFLALDFLDISMPQFSFPFIDAINIWSFVNLEVDIEFLVEMARQNALTVNAFTNDIVHILNIWIWDLDYRWIVPEDINIKTPLNETSFNSKVNKKISMFDFAVLITLNFLNLHKNLETISKTDLTNDEFKKEIVKNISKIDNEKIIWVWQNTLNYSFTKEDNLIKDLIQNNENKYNEVKSILQEEKQKNEEILNNIKDIFENKKENNILINSYKTQDNSSYNTRLEVYNQKAIASIWNLFKEDNEVSQIKNESKELLENTKTSLKNFEIKLNQSKKAFENVKINLPNNNLLATNITHTNSNTTTTNPIIISEEKTGTCNLNNNWYSYKYKWIYIIEQFIAKKISYLLFDYLDELNWKEISKEFDFDNDGDQDIIYMFWNEIYLKENLLIKEKNLDFYSGNPIVLNSKDNPYFKDVFYKSLNNLKETVTDNGYTNIWFSDSLETPYSNYRIEILPIIDRFKPILDDNLNQSKKSIIDAFSDIDKNTLSIEKTSNYTIRNNLAYINSIWNLAWVVLETKELKNILSDIKENKEIIINAKTKIYSWNNAVKLVYYLYKEKNNELKLKEVKLDAYSNIEFDEDIVLVWLNQDAFVEWINKIELTWNQIINYIKKPLLPETKIYYTKNELSSQIPFLSINYYDKSNIELDFSKINYYELYDLWYKSDSYLVRTRLENGFYYAKIKSFKNNIFSSYSNQAVLSPQKESDTISPEINWLSTIKLPVFTKQTFDLTPYIFENSWIENVKSIFIDFDLTKDSSWDKDNYNDKDFVLWVKNDIFNVNFQNKKIIFEIWPFDKIISKNIRIFVWDNNDNIWFKDIKFEVYSPSLKIKDIKESSINGWLDEELKNTPVSIYRIRFWNIEKLTNHSWNTSSPTSQTWTFLFELENNSYSWVIFTHSWETIFSVNEETWKINISNLSKIKYKIDFEVLASNDLKNEFAYPKIIVKKENNPIYYQYLSIPNTWKVEVTNDFIEITKWQYKSKIWVYYKHNSSNFNFVSLPLWILENAWDLIVFNKNKNIIFEVFKDWRINTKNENYYLEYSNFWDYVVYKLRQKWLWETIAEVMIIPEKNYIIK